MQTHTRLFFSFILILGTCPLALAQDNSSAGSNGHIIEQTLFTLPTYDQIPARFKGVYSKEAVEEIENSPDLDLLKIKYMSDGLKVAGFIYKPKATSGKRLPLVI